VRSLNFLALRNLEQSWLRSALSALAVALGAAMIVGAQVISEGVRSGIQAAEANKDATTWLTDMLEVNLNGVGVVILLAAGFLIFNAFAMAVSSRRRQIGALRSLGMTRRQVMRLLLVEALLIGGSGSLLGLIAGPLIGRGILSLMRAVGVQIGSGSVSLESLGAAIVLGVGTTLLSVLLPARRAARISPLVALRQEMPPGVARTPLWLAGLGLAIAVGLATYLIIAPPGTWTLPPWDLLMPLLLSLLWLFALVLILSALIGALGQIVRWLVNLVPRWQTMGRLIADNLRRDRRRVMLTILTLVVGLTTIVSITGIFTFTSKILVGRLAERALQQTGWIVLPIDVADSTVLSVLEEFDLDTLAMDPQVVDSFYELAEGRAEISAGYAVIAPEIGAVVPSYPSFIYDLDILTRPGFYTLVEGDWNSALPVMKGGCGLLIPPGVAARNQVGIGDTITLEGTEGLIDCKVAGLGAGGYHPASYISPAARETFDVRDPAALLVFPLPDTDREVFEDDLRALADRHGTKAGIMEPQDALDILFFEGSDLLLSLLDSLLLLAVVAAALGVANTTVISVAERRRELGLLRAVGATKRQTMAIVTGEAALMGVLGGGLGLIAGVGAVIIFAVSFGGNGWGIADLPLWPSAWASVKPALLNGILGLLAAPLVCAGAAWLPTRSVVRGTAIETMEPERQARVASRRVSRGTARGGTRLVDLFSLGSIRTRFVLGTALLLLIVLGGLIGVVTRHERTHLEDQMGEMLLTMVEGQAGMIELTLPADAQTIDLASLQAGQFDADELLRFRALMDDVSEHGLEEFVVVDRDSVIVLSLDPRDMGTLADTDSNSAYPKEIDEPGIVFERTNNEWRVYAAAPVRNEEESVVGSVQMTINLAEGEEFIRQTRETLWLVGGGLASLGLALSWALTTPVVATTQQLTRHAARIARGEYAPILRRPQSALSRAISWLVDRTSLRLRLTVAMLLVVALLVGVLETAVVPIERYHVERTLKDGMLGAAEWMGQLFSESFDLDQADVSLDQLTGLDEMLELTQDMDLAKLQELGEELQSRDVAYVALVDQDGVVQISDQLSLVGETVPIPSETRIEEDRWRNEDIWVLSTPLHQKRGGEQIGALRFGLRRETVEAFLTETRNLFRLTGVIAALASVLLAQVVGSAVTAPVRQLASGVRRVGAGDLDVQFQVRTRDELSTLARAFNEMTAGLREREWLRDMFGRFVSREVAEAIRTGQVRLAGENRVVSVLFCDIRDFTRRSSLHTPEQMVALLNEYLPVVVQAAQHHAGTVNKFGGDSTLIIYGAPRRLQESAYRAVQTALEIRASLQALNARLAAQGQEPIRIGVGINTGVALAGAVGPEARQEYTVIGDTVNLASRIEALNKEYPEYDILISGWTYDALGTRRREFQFLDLGEIPIRGKVEPVRVWAVVG
jgi:class 3 adenylate cyclase/cell division protein FtsX